MEKYLVRIDDFPRLPMDCGRFMEFHEIMTSHQIPYLLGVTANISARPLESINRKIRGFEKEELEILKSIKNEALFAYHGTTHQTIREDMRSEFIGLGIKKTEETIRHGMSILKRHGFKTDIIIPPFNTFDIFNLQAFKKFFKAVTGGPETTKMFGKIPMGNLDGIFYVPSYRPFYGQQKDILRAVKTKNPKEITCITLHWAWDIKNDFKYVRGIAEEIEGKVLEWNSSLPQTGL